VVAKDIGRVGMSENPIKMIVEDYIDGAGQRERLGDPYYPYVMPVQVDELQLSKLHYLCQVLSAHPDELSWRMFQAALDLALDEYCEWSGKSHGQAHNERQEMLLQMEQQGYFKEFRKRGWVTAKRKDEE
jgi:hypothetical protein